MQDEEDDAAPGWDAISAALDRLYPGVEPRHFGTLVNWMLGGPDPLDGISAWWRAEPVPHWHYVTYGLSELYAKEWDDLATSGYGFELTFRLACAEREEEPPAWPMNLLQNLARYVFNSGNVFRSGDWMPANGPIATEHATALVSLGFVADPELPAIETAHGSVAFLQVVGLTAEEELAVKQWNTRGLLDALLPAMPLWVTDLDRATLLDAPGVRARIVQGEREEGSSSGFLFTDTLAWTRTKPLLRAPVVMVTLGARQVEELAALLPGRLPFGRPLRLAGKDAAVVFEPGEADVIAEDGPELHLQLTAATLTALIAAVRPRAGRYATPGLPGLAWQVEQTLVRDANGAVVSTIG